MSFRIDVIANRGRSPQTLLRESWREGKHVRHKTVANFTRLPPHIVDGFRAVLKGGAVFTSIEDAVSIRRSLAHGHVAAILGLAKKLGLPRILDRKNTRHGKLALAAIVARIITPASKLATARQLSPLTAASSLGTVLGLGEVTGNEMLAMLDWLDGRKRHIEGSLARRQLAGSAMVLYDVSSSFVEGRCCPLAARGHNRDGKKGKQQITYGLLCNVSGCPVAVDVFPGNTGDPSTVGGQVAKLQKRFRIERIAFVGDRGMLTSARIREDIRPAGLDWISALKTVEARKLLVSPDPRKKVKPPLRPEELVADQVAEITSPKFPGERLLVCLNPRLRKDRARKREELLAATEGALAEIAASAKRRKSGPKNRERIHAAVGEEANRWKVRKHFEFEIRDDGMSWKRNQAKIDAESRLDGIYIIRTSLPPAEIGAEHAVESYKALSRVERAFRILKADRLQVRPIYLYSEPRVRAHVFLCMLAYYLEWHMRQALAPLLFEDDDPEGARAKRTTPVQKAKPSDSAKRKAASKTTPEGLPVQSMTDLLSHLGSLTLNEVNLPGQPDSRFMVTSKPTELQAKAFALLELPPERRVYNRLPV